MEHKISLEGIGNQVLTMPIASASEKNERKNLRLILSDGFIEYVVRYYKDGELVGASKPLKVLNTAVRVYNDY